MGALPLQCFHTDYDLLVKLPTTAVRLNIIGDCCGFGK